jgi:hypothetical protein
MILKELNLQEMNLQELNSEETVRVEGGWGWKEVLGAYLIITVYPGLQFGSGLIDGLSGK